MQYCFRYFLIYVFSDNKITIFVQEIYLGNCMKILGLGRKFMLVTQCAWKRPKFLLITVIGRPVQTSIIGEEFVCLFLA